MHSIVSKSYIFTAFFFTYYKIPQKKSRNSIHLNSITIETYLGADHLISSGGLDFDFWIIYFLHSATNEIIFIPCSANHLTFSHILYIYVNMGQIVNKLLRQNKSYYFFKKFWMQPLYFFKDTKLIFPKKQSILHILCK